MRPGTLLRLGLAGTRTDTMRVVLTALSTALAALAVLTAANVVAIGQLTLHGAGSDQWAEQYSNALLREPGLRPGVVITLLLLTVPVFALAGQCARLGAPARDRRLAAFRLAGATPAQTVAVAAAETGVASLAGSLGGLAVYLAGHELLDRRDAEGRLPLPTDVFPHTWFVAVAVLAIPALAALAAAVVMRRVTVGPFGVVRRVRRTRGPGPWPGVFIVLGLLAFAAVGSASPLRVHLGYHIPVWFVPTMLLVGVACAGFGVVIGTGWIAYATGRLLHRRARRPSTVLAAARLVADPWSGSRTLAVLLICVLFGGGTAAVRAWIAAGAEVQRALDAIENPGSPTTSGLVDLFYLRTMDLIDAALLTAVALTAIAMLVVVAEGVVTRRREYASLVAAGVPRATLGRSMLWQALLPAVPAILVALVVGVALVRTIGGEVSAGGGTSRTCDAAGEHCRSTRHPKVVRVVPVPWAELSRDGGVAVLAVFATTGAGLLFLRRSTDLEEIRAT
ncbi:FtsX-like permease family protein [Dactylosporangium sp. NPDC000555]|uniref:FtsX-like permease family protein n=1 Tax=Dactylosporangium sp. NPDC000555 TaxID=3154260 RepID=UPI003330BFE3